MGWTTTHRSKGMSHREFFEREFPNTLVLDGEILACATIEDTFYAAVKNRASGQVWALVILISRAPRSHYNFGYKEMDETMGPNEAKAPNAILDLLTPTDRQYAIEWRKSCREYNARKAARPVVKEGQKVLFEHSFTFPSGEQCAQFTYLGRRTRFRSESGLLVRLPGNWRMMPFATID